MTAPDRAGRSSRQPARSPADGIRHLYYNATPASITRDLTKAISLLKSMADEDERARVAVFMDGLSQMRSEWTIARRPDGKRTAR